MTFNKTLILGRLGANPEIRTTQNGSEVARLRIATNERFADKKSGEKRERTDWHTVIVFASGLIDKVIKPYCKKGSSVFIEGRLQTRSYEKDGVTQYVTEIVADSLTLGGGKPAEASA